MPFLSSRTALTHRDIDDGIFRLLCNDVFVCSPRRLQVVSVQVGDGTAVAHQGRVALTTKQPTRAKKMLKSRVFNHKGSYKIVLPNALYWLSTRFFGGRNICAAEVR